MSAARIAANLRETGVFLGSSDINHGLRLATQTSTRLARILRMHFSIIVGPDPNRQRPPTSTVRNTDRHLIYRHLMYCVRDLERCVRPADVPASSALPRL